MLVLSSMDPVVAFELGDKQPVNELILELCCWLEANADAAEAALLLMARAAVDCSWLIQLLNSVFKSLAGLAADGLKVVVLAVRAKLALELRNGVAVAMLTGNFKFSLSMLYFLFNY